MQHSKYLTNYYLCCAVILTTVIISGCSKKPQANAASGPPAALVKLQRVETSTVENSTEFVGTLEAKQRVSLRPQTSGRIVQVTVAQGNFVKKGTPIIQLRPERNRASVDAAIASVNSQKGTLENATAQVRASEAEIKQRTSDIKRYQADIINRNSDVELANINYKRSEELVSAGAVAKQNLDERRAQRNSAIAAREAAIQSLAAAQSALQQAQSQWRGAVALVKQNESQLKRAQAETAVQVEDLSYNRVVAPVDGVVGDVPVRVGDLVNVGDAVTSIIQNDELDLRIPVPTNLSGQLRRGLPVTLIDPNSGTQISKGSINFIAPQVSTGDQAVLIKARFPNKDQKLRDGQYVRARIIWSTGAGVKVPAVAVSTIGAQDFVFVAESETKNGKSQLVARQKPVKLGVIQGQDRQLLSGIQPGENLIVSGIQSLTNGAPIKPAATETAFSQ
ncbi:RND family efflux transporter MFP subunit [Calothrix sp. NIES-4071]|nr:RND family efflux transporter MFP subunit [Calothrix sp. NIES-4071]BAZ56677.1 RND family efflux transporter MFP subunit [Calothrix sp. NIES-4105]